jgi:AcrR family transcriptional regulator
MGQHGLSGIAVEPLAKSLGATKGSFYWHFRDREELVTAALERWEQEGTEAVIATLQPVADGHARLRQLLTALFVTPSGATDPPSALRADAEHKAVDISIALTADPEHPAVAEVIARVTARRVSYIADQLSDLGINADEARRRALLAYTAYLGSSTLARSAPGTMPQGRDAERLVESMVSVLTQ